MLRAEEFILIVVSQLRRIICAGCYSLFVAIVCWGWELLLFVCFSAADHTFIVCKYKPNNQVICSKTTIPVFESYAPEMRHSIRNNIMNMNMYITMHKECIYVIH